MSTSGLPSVQSVLLIVNRPAGTGRSAADLDQLRLAFETCFAAIPRRVFQVADGHADVLRLTREFLSTQPGPHALLAGGGGGTTRAVINGLLSACAPGTPALAAVRVGVLRLGSGNLMARRLGMPADPSAGLRVLAEGLCAGQVQPGWAYRCTLHLPDGSRQVEHGLALGSLGQFARVPAAVERWKQAHLGLVRWATRLVPLEVITNVQYGLFSLGRAAAVVLRPSRAEQIEIRQAGRSERLRLLAGVLLKFDLPQIPVRAVGQFSEPRLTLGLLQLDSRRQLLAVLWHCRDFDGRLRKYVITPQAPLDMCYLGPKTVTVAVDEDTLTTAAQRLTWEVVGPLNFITGLAISEATA